MAEACGVPERGARLVRQMKARLDVVRAAVDEVRGAGGRERPKVAHLEWIAPLMGSLRFQSWTVTLPHSPCNSLD